MKQPHETNDHHYLSLGIVIGAGGGVALGLVMMTIFDNPGFFALGIAIGVSIGTAVGAALDQQGENHAGN